MNTNTFPKRGAALKPGHLGCTIKSQHDPRLLEAYEELQKYVRCFPLWMHAELEDHLQDAFTQAATHLEKGRDITNPYGFLRRCFGNKRIDYSRSKRPQPLAYEAVAMIADECAEYTRHAIESVEHRTNLLRQVGMSEKDLQSLYSDVSSLREREAALSKKLVEFLLKELPSRPREVIELWMRGVARQEIAVRFGCSPASGNSMVWRALEQLRRIAATLLATTG